MEPQKPIEILLEEVKKIRSNLDRINKDIANIKNKIKEEDDKDKYTILDNNREVVPSKSWFY